MKKFTHQFHSFVKCTVFKTAFFLVASVLIAGCSATIYKNPKFHSYQSSHRTLAILPFQVTIDPKKLPKDFTPQMAREAEKEEAYTFQQELYIRFLKRQSKGKYTINFQDVDETNALLAKAGVEYEDLRTYTKTELKRVLGVDAVLSGSIFRSRPMSTGWAMALLAVGLPFGKTNRVDVNINIHDVNSGTLVWKYDHKASGSIGSSSQGVAESLMKNIAKKFPYRFDKKNQFTHYSPETGPDQKYAPPYTVSNDDKIVSDQVFADKPPQLETELAFREPSGNNLLDAEEIGTIELTIRNNGLGMAREVIARLKMAKKYSGISFSKHLPVGDIPANSQRTALFELTADDDIPTGTVTFNIEILESNGFDADPLSVTFSTREIQAPELQLVDFTLDDDAKGESQGNNNGKMEPGELVEVTVTVQNKGIGEAQNASIDVKLDAGNAFFQSTSTRFSLGNLEPGKWEKISFALFTNKRFNRKKLPISITLNERRRRFRKKAKIELPVHRQEKQPESLVITGNYDDPITRPASIPVLNSDVDNPRKTHFDNENAIAVVIGNARYEHPQVPDVDYALRDAGTMKEYLVHTLGYREENIILKENVDKASLEGIFGNESDYRGLLYRRTYKKQPEVFIYYTGHGFPSSTRDETYLVPSNFNPEFDEVGCYSVKTLYKNLAKLESKEITLVIDACFNGNSPRGALFQYVSPVFIRPTHPALTLDNAIVFTASASDQLSNWFPEAKHGLFTFYFLKGIKGDADLNGDQKITVSEMESFLDSQVSDRALVLFGRDQTPQVIGRDKGRVLVDFSNTNSHSRL